MILRLKNLFGMAAMLALAASCSENELVESGGTGANENGPHYATFTIKLPTTNGTRADGEPTYDDGTADEYAVGNATLLVFEKAAAEPETDATLVEKVELGDMKPWNKVDDDPNAITTEANITAKLNNFKPSNEKNYYAVVLLNNNITTSSTKVTVPTLNQTFGEWQKAQVSNKITDKTNGFYMANAVKVTSSGATETLVLIDKDKVTTTESAAQPAATIHVERGVAKVTMTTFSQMNVEGIDGDKVTITAWDLDVTNKKSYPVHNVNNFAGFAGYWDNVWSEPRFTSGHTAFNRAHWGIDPNYSTLNIHDQHTDEREFNKQVQNYEMFL